MASINTSSFNLRALIESKEEKLSPRKVWVPKYCLVCVDRLNKEWVAVCTDPLSGNSMKGIQQETKQHNQFSKERKLFPRGKMNSPGYRFVPYRKMVIERPTPPWGKFTMPRENDACRFREYSSRNIAFSLRGKFTPPKGRFFPPREKIVDNFTTPKKKAREGHVSPVMTFFQEVDPVLQGTK